MNDFPSLPERDLPEGRRRLLKEHLLNELSQEDTATAPTSAAARKRWLRPAFAGPALAGVLSLAVVGGLALAGTDGSEGTRPAPGPGTVAGPKTGSGSGAGAMPADAVQLLERVATVADAKPLADTIRDDQYVYIKSKISYIEESGCTAPELQPPSEREIWFSVDGTREGALRGGSGRATPIEAPTPGIASNTYYRHLETLPTDPDKMLDWLHKASDGGKSEAQNTFVLVGDLIRESLVPPKVSAALYRAAARIPGVTLVPDATDATGRQGIAVGRVDEQSGLRDEWVFDKKTYEYLGERGVATRATKGALISDKSGVTKQCPGMPAGQVTSSTAVLERKVVDAVPGTAAVPKPSRTEIVPRPSEAGAVPKF
jgi:hypothetical protein